MTRLTRTTCGAGPSDITLHSNININAVKCKQEDQNLEQFLFLPIAI